jgi:microcin C transport system permease protein
MSDIQVKTAVETVRDHRRRPFLSPLNQRRWMNFKANRRGYWSLWIFLVLFVLSLFSELIANDRPIIASYKGEILFPVLVDYPEEKFGGFLAVADYRDPAIHDEIEAHGWLVWPPIRYSYRTVNNEIPTAAPAKPSWLYPRRCAASVIRRASTIRAARSATGIGSAPTTRRATYWPASSTASAYRCCSASS